MANVLAQFRADLYALIKTALPEVVSPIASVPQIQRINWVEKIQNGELTAPWVAIHLPALTPETEWSVSAPTWSVSPTIYYIAAVSAGQGAIGDYLEARMSLVQDALMYRFGYTVPSDPVTDCSEENPVNASLLMNDQPYLCGSLTFSALVGCTS